MDRLAIKNGPSGHPIAGYRAVVMPSWLVRNAQPFGRVRHRFARLQRLRIT